MWCEESLDESGVPGFIQGDGRPSEGSTSIRTLLGSLWGVVNETEVIGPDVKGGWRKLD